MNEASEKILWNLFVEGDLKAFSSLFKNYYPQLHNYGLKISANATLTEDCLQSFFVYLHKNRKNLGDIKHIKSYLFISFRRALLKNLKKERVFTSYDEDTLFEKAPVFEFSKEELLIQQEFSNIRTATLSKLLNNLSVREREVIYLKYYSDLSTREIAEVMDISYQSVLNTLQKAFNKLRNRIENGQIRQVFQKS